MRGRWERTREAADAAGAPEPLLAQTRALLQEIDTTRTRVNTRLEAVLSVLGRVNESQGAIDEVLTQVDSAEVAARERLLSPDSPPLWRAILAPVDTVSLAGELGASWRETGRDWRSYIEGSSHELLVVLMVVVLLLGLLQALRRQATAWAEQGRWPVTSVELEGTQRILSRPVSAALVLTVVIWRSIFDAPPPAVGAVIMAAMVVPVLRLLPGSVFGALRRPMYGLAALWVLGEGAVLILDGSLLQRLFLLVIAAVVGAGLYWGVRPGSPIREAATGRWWRAAVTGGQIGIVLMGASLLANVMGFASLTEVLTRGTIHGAAAALVAVTVVNVLDGLLWMLLHTDWALRLRVIQNHARSLTTRLLMLTHLGIFLLWLSVVLMQFRLQRPVMDALGSILGAQLTLGTFDISLGDILAFAFVLWLALLVSRGIRAFLEEDVLQSVNLPRGVPTAISTLVHYAAVFIGFLMAAAAGGFDMSRFTLLAGAFGVGLGFGLQNVVNNFVSGLILIFERPIQIEDVVEVGSIQGRVKRIGIRASTVRTWSGAEVIVPNGDLISQQVTNWTLSDRLRRMEVVVGVKYGTDPQRVIDLLLETVTRHPEVLGDPEPVALFQGFGASSLDFVVRAWTASESWWTVNSDLAVAVNNALKEADIEIPFPQRDLHLRTVSPEVKLKE